MKNKIIPSILLAAFFAAFSCSAIEDTGVNKLKSMLSGFAERAKEGDFSDSQKTESDKSDKKEEKESKDEKKKSDTDKAEKTKASSADSEKSKESGSESGGKSFKEKFSNFIDSATERIKE